MRKIPQLAMSMILAVSSLALPVVAQQPSLTPEQQFQLLQMMLNKRQQQGMGQPAVEAAPLPVKSESELAEQFEPWKALEQGVVFERLRDGFTINGERYIDPEGKITSYGFDMQSGDFTYLAQSANQFVLKSGRAFNQAEPIVIASATQSNGMWSVSTVTGKKFSGQRLIPLARGFIVARDNTGFRYVPGKGTTNFSGPETFSIAGLQNGEISSTGYILLERIPQEPDSSSSGAFGSLISSAKSLGSTLGIGKKEDYALLNIDTKQIVPVNISIEDKEVQVMSQCRKQNGMMNSCQKMDSYESLFKPDGRRNMTHYFWRINWLNANGRSVLISQEGGLSKVSETDLTTGKKVILFERTLGISDFSVAKNLGGKVSVTAQLGFSSETKDDVVPLLDTLPDVSEKKEAP